MFEQRIGKKEFLRDPFEAATEVLLGSYLCSTIGGKLTAGRITELEVYIGAEDKACHAYLNRKTPRNAAMFETGGCAYVFFVYGMYNQFNVVLNEAGTANAALIRGLEPVAGIETMQDRRGTDRLDNLTTGPGKLCQGLAVSKTALIWAATCCGCRRGTGILLGRQLPESVLIMPKNMLKSLGDLS